MPTAELKGVFPYLVSPVDANGRVKTDVLTALVEHLIEAGVHGLTPLGSTGEFAYLDTKQRIEIVDCVVRAARGRVPVVAGVASTTTAGAVELAKTCRLARRRRGARDPRSLFSDFRDAGVEAYFKAIADAVPCPIVLYTNPQFQRSDLTLTVIKRLSSGRQHPLHQGCVDEHGTAPVDPERDRRADEGLRRLGPYPGLRDADRRRRLDGGACLHRSARKRRAL